MNILLEGAELFMRIDSHTDGWRDGHGKANSCFPHFAKEPKNWNIYVRTYWNRIYLLYVETFLQVR